MSPTEALNLEIEIAQLAAQYVRAKDPATRARLMVSMTHLAHRREPGDADAALDTRRAVGM